jgi:hypothetical protein
LKTSLFDSIALLTAARLNVNSTQYLPSVCLSVCSTTRFVAADPCERLDDSRLANDQCSCACNPTPCIPYVSGQRPQPAGASACVGQTVSLLTRSRDGTMMIRLFPVFVEPRPSTGGLADAATSSRLMVSRSEMPSRSVV